MGGRWRIEPDTGRGDVRGQEKGREVRLSDAAGYPIERSLALSLIVLR